MSVAYSVSQLDDAQVDLVIKEIEHIDKDVAKKVDLVVQKTGLPRPEALEYVVVTTLLFGPRFISIGKQEIIKVLLWLKLRRVRK
jgi:hypothetical protein